MLKIHLTTTQKITYSYLILDRTNYSLDHYIGLVCKSESCPKSAITKIEISEV